MAEKKNTTVAAATGLYLVLETGEAAVGRLAAILAAAEPASVMVVPRPGRSYDAEEARALIAACQSAGVAAFIADDARLARTLRADGLHLSPAPGQRARFDEAREILGGRAMIGVEIAAGAEETRHEAMEFAEAGADYIAFAPGDGQIDLIDWWSGIFEVPCVGMGAGDEASAAAIAAAGAEFVAITLPPACPAADSAARVLAIAAVLQPSASRGALA